MKEKDFLGFKKVPLGIISAACIFTTGVTGFAQANVSTTSLPENLEVSAISDVPVTTDDNVLGEVTDSDILSLRIQEQEGTVAGVNKLDSSITVKLPTEEKISLEVSENTYWVDAKTGLAATAFDSVKLNDNVAVYYEKSESGSSDESVKNIAKVIIVNLQEDAYTPVFLEVDFINKNGEDMFLFTESGLNSTELSSEAKIFDYATSKEVGISAVTLGCDIVIWPVSSENSSELSENTQKALILGYRENVNSEKINIISEDGETFRIENTDFTFGEGEAIIGADGVVHLPVRILANAVGCTVDWVEEASGVRLTRGNSTVYFTIGSNDYSVNKARFIMEHAPKLIGKKTYVPIDLFTEILRVDVSLNGEPITLK